jgi:hypothetical protein
MRSHFRNIQLRRFAMSRGLLFGFLVCCVLLVGPVSHGDVATNSSTSTSMAASAPVGTGIPAATEPITARPVTPAHGWETKPRDPFAPYDIGPGKGNTSKKPFWQYADLNAEEKAWADKNADTSKWQPIHDAFAAAAAEQAQRAAASSAASQLGIDGNLAGLGVVP